MQKKKRHSKEKGQATLIGHAVLIAISIFLVLIVVYTFNNIRREYQQFIGSSDMEQICYLLRGSMEKIYNPGNYHSPTNTTYGSIKIILPQRIADLKYRARFLNNMLNIETLASPRMNITCLIGLNASLAGFTTGGTTEILYRETGNGAREILLTQVD